MGTSRVRPVELWGGIEATINRVGDRFFNQLDRNGHFQRADDLERIAELGIRTLRFPVLWEQLAPDSLEQIDWAWSDYSLGKLRELGIRPIVGLVHHGSGPRYTELRDPGFPQKLARFAAAVAQRYPWVDAYTPVNEPLTTARFSGLYGHWYPHRRDEPTFARCLVNECRGVSLAMRAIRQINGAAQLVQTDDLGKTYSSPQLQNQADYDNERRWLTWDLLTGKIDHNAAMWRSLIGAGIGEDELVAFEERPCPPDLIGVNHYITSDRFLDHDLDAHPPETHGGNGRDQYADVAAVRIRREGISGTAGVLREAWQRYRLPLAVTEAHIGCTRDEQLRWLSDVWGGAAKLSDEGVDVRAVTVWSLLGAFDWNSLLTRQEDFYEPGAYDLRGGVLRPTAIAKMMQKIAHGRTFDHPVLDTPGWWRRTVRMIEPTAGADRLCPRSMPLTTGIPQPTASETARPILITGAAGRLAQGFIRAAKLRGLPYRLFSHTDLDIADEAAVADALKSCAPWAVINCAGFSRVDAAEAEEQTCLRSNTHGPAVLAALCAQTQTQLVTFSSAHVFDGGKCQPYLESDEVSALNVYGESKILGEGQALRSFPQALVIRAGEILAPLENDDFLRGNLRAIARGDGVRVENDVHFSGSYLPDLVHATLDLLVDGESGLWHLANSGAVTAEQLLIAAAEIIQLDAGRIEGVASWRLNRRALRSRYRVLGTERGQLLPPLEDALRRYCWESPEIWEPVDELLATS